MNKKTRVTLLILFMLSFIMISISATFAYFTSKLNTAVSKKEEVTSATMETLTYIAGEPLNITANLDNFAQNMDSLTKTSYSYASLYAGSEDKVFKHYYDTVLNITNNDFVYGVNEDTPELLLEVVEPEGKVVTKAEGLEFKTINGYSGFDITNKKGSFILFDDHLIETRTEITQEWKITIIFVNLDKKQNANLGKTFEGNIVIGGNFN